MNETKPDKQNETKAAGPGAPAPGAPATPANDDAAATAAGIAAAMAEDASMPDARLAALEAELAAKVAELAAFKDSAQRQLAEIHNQRRRADNELADARKYGPVPLAKDMLGIADNLKRALAAATPAGGGDAAPTGAMLESLRQGVELIDREFAAILERHGIKRLDPKGEKFDPNFHQAMFEVPTASAEPGTVVEVVQPGYRLHDRLLRAAMVGVAKAMPAADAAK